MHTMHIDHGMARLISTNAVLLIKASGFKAAAVNFKVLAIRCSYLKNSEQVRIPKSSHPLATTKNQRKNGNLKRAFKEIILTLIDTHDLARIALHLSGALPICLQPQLVASHVH